MATEMKTSNSQSPAPIVLDHPPNMDARRIAEEELRRIAYLADLLDNKFSIGGYKVGWDGIIGLIPGIGDLVTAGVSAYIIYIARKHGVSKWAMLKMIANSGIDLTVGVIPVVGDVADFLWKANAKNLRIVQKQLEKKLSEPHHFQ